MYLGILLKIWKEVFVTLISKINSVENLTMYKKSQNSGFYQRNVIFGISLKTKLSVFYNIFANITV